MYQGLKVQNFTVGVQHNSQLDDTIRHNGNDALLGQGVEIMSNNFPLLANQETIPSGSVYFYYQKSPSAFGISISFEICPSLDLYGRTLKIDLTLPTGATLDSTSRLNPANTGTNREIIMPLSSSVNRLTIIDAINVDACTSSSLLEFVAKWTAITGSATASTSHGFKSITVSEYGTNPEEPSDPSGSLTSKIIYDNPYSSDLTVYKNGFQQFARVLDQARTEIKNQFNISSIYNEALSWCFKKEYVDGSEDVLEYGQSIAPLPISVQRKFYLRARNLYGATGGATIQKKIQLLYSSLAGSSYEFSIYYRNYGSGDPWNVTTLEPDSGVDFKKASTTFTIEVDEGFQQIIECYFTARVFDPGGRLLVHNVWIGDDDT